MATRSLGAAPIELQAAQKFPWNCRRPQGETRTHPEPSGTSAGADTTRLSCHPSPVPHLPPSPHSANPSVLAPGDWRHLAGPAQSGTAPGKPPAVCGTSLGPLSRTDGGPFPLEVPKNCPRAGRRRNGYNTAAYQEPPPEVPGLSNELGGERGWAVQSWARGDVRVRVRRRRRRGTTPTRGTHPRGRGSGARPPGAACAGGRRSRPAPPAAASCAASRWTSSRTCPACRTPL